MTKNRSDLTCRSLHPIYVSHIEGSFLIVVLSPCKIKKRIKWRRDFLWSPHLNCISAAPPHSTATSRLAGHVAVPNRSILSLIEGSKTSAAGEGAFAL